MLILGLEISLGELRIEIEKLRIWYWFWVICTSNWCWIL